MPKQTIPELKQLVQRQFQLQRPMLSTYQIFADNFYPERADFTTTRNIGADLADRLVDSYPILVRRDLGNSFSAMLRDGDWFDVGIAGGEPDYEGNTWLQWSTLRLRSLFDDRKANFVRATKEGDHDYATFGQTVISTELNRQANGLLFRNWHLRDCAWWEDETGQVSGLVRKWKTTYRQLVDYFGENALHKNITDKVSKEPFKEIEIFHITMPSVMYGDDQIEERNPYVSIFLDPVNDHEIEVIGINHKMYTVPRFQTISGSAYAYSPATMIALPDARTLQAMTHTILEAGERYARPPLIATSKVIRGDVNLNPDGVTWVDQEYDEKLGGALRPLYSDKGGFSIGTELREGIAGVLQSAFFLNKITLPETNRDMTAYEVSERMKQFRRENLPLFSPMESEYNGQLCETAFDVAMQAGLLGSVHDIPDSLRDHEVRFTFVSPLSRSEEEEKATRFSQVRQMLAEAAEMDQNIIMNVDLDSAVRDAITGIGAPMHWLRPEEQVQQTRQVAAAKEAAGMAMEMAQNMPEGAEEQMMEG